MVSYLDASALVKLAIPEPESEALVTALADVRCVTSTIGMIELARTVRRQRPDDAEERIDAVTESVAVLPLHVATAAAAGAVRPTELRALEAVHLATALAISDDVDAIYCYDARLSEAAAEYGLRVLAPR